MRIKVQHIRFAMSILRNPSQRKHLRRWVSSLHKDYFIDQKMPWFVYDAIDLLDTEDLAGKRVFEYGSGGSTLFWLKKGAHCVSVEHDPDWYQRARLVIPAKSFIDYRLVLPEPDLPELGHKKDYADPNDFVSAEYATHAVNYEKYVRQIDEFPDGYFDIVLVDGRARPSCIKHSIRKVNLNGLLILDNSDRSYYSTHTQPFLSQFSKQTFEGVGPVNPSCWSTTLFKHIV